MMQCATFMGYGYFTTCDRGFWHFDRRGLSLVQPLVSQIQMHLAQVYPPRFMQEHSLTRLAGGLMETRNRLVGSNTMIHVNLAFEFIGLLTRDRSQGYRPARSAESWNLLHTSHIVSKNS